MEAGAAAAQVEWAVIKDGSPAYVLTGRDGGSTG